MAFPDDALAGHEELVLNLHPHGWVLIKPAAVLIAATVIGGGLALTHDSGPLSLLVVVVILASAVWFLVRFAVWYTTFFVLTSDRVIYRAGVLSKSSVEILLGHINAVLVQQHLLERMIRVGDIEIESASRDGMQRFDDIRRPADVQKEIYVQMKAAEDRRYGRGGPVGQPGEATGVAGSIPDQINQLARLRDQGYLSDAEFQAKKTELLNRL